MLRITNPTLQEWTVPYRIGALGTPEFGIMRQFTLSRGGQIELLLGPNETAQLINQLEAHGARDASDINRHMGKFSGLVYSDVRPVTEDEILVAHDIDTQTREDRAVTQAVKAGLGFDKQARKANNQRAGARTTEVEVTQEVPRGQRRTGGEVTFAMTVTPDGGEDPIVRKAVAA